MRGYGVAFSDNLSGIVAEIQKRTDRSITEVFIFAVENLALTMGLVDRIEDIYTEKTGDIS